MVRRITDDGLGAWHEPPYTEEEALEIYAGVSAKGGVTMLHGSSPPGAQPQPQPEAPPPPARKPRRS
jgi:hypothetical protein